MHDEAYSQQQTEASLQALSARLEHAFNQPDLLLEALTHASYVNEDSTTPGPYQRLEFLGDAVVELTVSEYLWERYPDHPEGLLTRRRAAMVQERALAWWARQLDLGPHIRLGRGEATAGRAGHPALLADVLEAVVGAIFVDGGFGAARRFVRAWVAPLEARIDQPDWADHKTALQELLQARGAGTPTYRTAERIGPSHAPVFAVSVDLGGQELATGEGASIKEAGQDAARRALQRLHEDEHEHE